MEDFRRKEYEIYNNGFIKVLGVKEVRRINHFDYYDDNDYTDDYKDYYSSSYNDDKDTRFYLLIKTNSSEYDLTDYGSIKIDYVKDYEINKKGLYACEIIVNSSILSHNIVINIDRCEVSKHDNELYFAYGINNHELERIETEASMVAINYASTSISSKDEYLRNYNEAKIFFTNQLILQRRLSSSVVDNTFKQKIKEHNNR